MYIAAIPRIELSPEISAKKRWGCDGDWAGPRDENTLGVLMSMHSLEKLLFTIQFPFPCELPSSPLRSQITTSSLFFCLQPMMVFKIRASATWVSYSVFLGQSCEYGCSLVNLPAMLETLIRCLGQKDPLEKGMATHSSILAWRIPWTEKPGGPQPMGSQRVGHDLATNTPMYTLLNF